TTTFTNDKTWQPNDTTSDSGNVAIGSHHPRVDYATNQLITANGTLTVEPDTVIAMGADTGLAGSILVYGKLVCDGGTDFTGGRIRFMQKGLCSAGWAKNLPRSASAPYLQIMSTASPLSSISFTEFSGLGWGMFCRLSLATPPHDNIFRWNNYGVYKYGGAGSSSVSNSLFIENATGHAMGGGDVALNNTYDRNVFGIVVNSGVIPTITNCTFTNTVTSANSSGIRCYLGSPAVIEHHNAFYNNSYNYLFMDMYGQKSIGTLSGTDFVLTGDPYYSGWTDFRDRFYLPQTSQLVNGGDPADGPMWGYTTDPANHAIDMDVRDIGYHYPVVSLDTDSDGLLDCLEYWAGTLHNNPDTDGDGMPDGWEVQYGLNPLNPADAQGSPLDNDDYSNLCEYLHGTDPRTYNGSMPTMTISVQPGGLT
ncbi:MAG: hypothetical protein Q7T18_10915, partial [Sedimentisphaerales bacterium]|nr:hypothetical protein [Sedimentisphaerales bacterium]